MSDNNGEFCQQERPTDNGVAYTCCDDEYKKKIKKEIVDDKQYYGTGS
jgi:hypothetical protein